ncbi:S8 family peptidase [Dyadobacter sandarakinus]|uniref:S8 family peptidase n=1 Tax=Dyadobacter sandarakinus TaxID=2747268 RepID=A0ABX7I6M4_9BACT|nr:S8 family peptidase [Dyadobacter sandarakinus]QRR01756.1 S8 family peptidase [Dyadobacter sandarakinus]
MNRILLLTLFVFSVYTNCRAQSNPRYLILFKDKKNSPYSIEKPAEYLSQRAISRRNRQGIALTTADLPVNPAYVDAVRKTGAMVIYTSRWFNGTLVEASDSQLKAIKELSFYKGTELNLPVANLTMPSEGVLRSAAVTHKFGTTEDIDYGNARAQLALMQVPVLHQRGFEGQGMIIAVLDNGFVNGNTVGYLKALRDENRIADTHDFVARDGDVYNDGSHGLNVLSTMAAYDPGRMVGGAFKASYALYRTENDDIEAPYEEITWLLAAERADSLGADVINSSLGYNTFEGPFNNAAYNHTYADMDGKTTIISRAARYASRTGMVVVTAAGNEGGNSWRYITAPADVDSVLTVGASTYDRSYASLSSVGPNAAGQQKPDVAAVGVGAIIGGISGNVSSGNGTSFASPLVAGLAAILWQAHPELTAQQLIYALKHSGHQADRPDNFLGYGVPDVVRAETIIEEQFTPLGTEPEIIGQMALSPNPTQKEISIAVPAALAGKQASFSLFSVSGAKYWSAARRLQTKEMIAIADLPSGIYLLHVMVENQEKTFRFFKQ